MPSPVPPAVCGFHKTWKKIRERSLALLSPLPLPRNQKTTTNTVMLPSIVPDLTTLSKKRLLAPGWILGSTTAYSLLLSPQPPQCASRVHIIALTQTSAGDSLSTTLALSCYRATTSPCCLCLQNLYQGHGFIHSAGLPVDSSAMGQISSFNEPTCPAGNNG